MKASPPFNKVLYQTGETLTDNLIRGIVKMDAGRDTLSCYRDWDMLLMDDLSCLRGKGATQKETLCFLDAMKRQGVRILCTLLDCSVSEELIVSRFPGKILEIVPPSGPIVKRIIERKAAEHSLSVTEKQVIQIAAKTRGNGFLIEGTMKRFAFQRSVAF